MDPRLATGAEAAVFGITDALAIRGLIDDYCRDVLRAKAVEILFRRGRVDAVWGLRLDDGRSVVVKAHRPPVDLEARLAAAEAQRILHGRGFPAPEPVAETRVHEGVALSTDPLMSAGSAPDARDRAIRRALAAGLARQVELLRSESAPGAAESLAARAGAGPAWCRYQGGAWPVPHDPVFDFTVTPAGFEWLDGFASGAAAVLGRGAASAAAVTVGHADWCAGNVRFEADRLVGTFDWDLVAAPEPHLAGFAAAGFTDGGSGDASAPSPDEAAAFIEDYSSSREDPFSDADWEQASAAASWTLACNARCQLSLAPRDPAPPGSALDLLGRRREDYATLARFRSA